MDKINREVNETFKLLFAYLSKSYSDVSKSTSQSYSIGKKEAYEEVLNWLLLNHNGDLKYISQASFHSMMMEKITKVKIALKRQDDEEELKPNLENKTYDNKKKLHRQLIQEQRENNNIFNSYPMNIQSIFQQQQQQPTQYYNNSNNSNNLNGELSDDSMNSGILQKRYK